LQKSQQDTQAALEQNKALTNENSGLKAQVKTINANNKELSQKVVELIVKSDQNPGSVKPNLSASNTSENKTTSQPYLFSSLLGQSSNQEQNTQDDILQNIFITLIFSIILVVSFACISYLFRDRILYILSGESATVKQSTSQRSRSQKYTMNLSHEEMQRVLESRRKGM